MSKFFCNGADSECACPILCADCTAADWTGGTEIKTNADRIRAMSDEELAEFLIDLADDGNLKIREWLQMQAEEAGHER